MVYYTIPEDFDDCEQPNAFGIGKSIETIKLSDIKRLFPIEGTYHFRFKYVSNKTTIWMDLKDDDSIVIPFQTNIVMKVTRISWDSTVPQPVLEVKKPQETTAKTSPLNLFDFEPAPQKKSPEKYSNNGVKQFDLLFPN